MITNKQIQEEAELAYNWKKHQLELQRIIYEMKMAKSVLEKHEESCGWNHIGVKIAICNSIKWLEDYINSSTSHNKELTENQK